MTTSTPRIPSEQGDLGPLQRAALVVIGVASALVGVWAQVFPRSFYDSFPGAGRVWVAVDGPFNEHLVRDVGGLNLALALVAFAGLATRSELVGRVAGGAALVYGLPHLVYHVANLEGFEPVDAVGMVVSLSIATLAAVLAMALPTRRRGEGAIPS